MAVTHYPIRNVGPLTSGERKRIEAALSSRIEHDQATLHALQYDYIFQHHISSLPVEALGLPLRTGNALLRRDIQTLQHLYDMRDRLMEIRNLGTKSEDLIREALCMWGYQL